MQTVTLYTAAGEALRRAGADARRPSDYPRPQMRRDSFFSLDGWWQVAINGGAPEPILVPFPPESPLSGIGRDTGRAPRLRYTRRFTLPEGFVHGRVLLHFGAVDQIARVSLNGRLLGEHRGGYTHFSFEITDCLKADNLLEVEADDNLADGVLPYGKQSLKRGGMWYTPISGIWQTVWLESVPDDYVRGLRITPEGDGVTVTALGVTAGVITVETPDGPLTVSLAAANDAQPAARAVIRPPHPRRWSPEDPYLYRFTLRAGEDCVASYFALRTLTVERIDGLPRLCLNGRPYFFHGLLDQGYFSDGIYTPADPSGYADDILAMKNMGFNTLRKHIKIEPDRFYYDCDRLGMVVFQDMVNNGGYSFLRDTALPTVGVRRIPDRLLHRGRAARAAFIAGMEETVEQLYNHPCICYWTIFNEGWGQFDHVAAYRRLRGLDDTRFIDSISGWFKPLFGDGESDVESLHVYFRRVKIRDNRGGRRPVVLSEFGGYACRPEGHAFNLDKTYGYRILPTPEALTDAVERLYLDEIRPAIARGLCAAIYTQVSDVEDETNGLLSYDRRVTKVDPARMRGVAEQLKL